MSTQPPDDPRPSDPRPGDAPPPAGSRPFGSAGAGLPSTGASDEEEVAVAKTANRFDIRRIIGGVFLLYGVVLVITGLVGSNAVKHKADGIDIDLWTGIGMLVFAALMLFWAFKRPTEPEPPETRGEGSGRLRRSPA